jgi:hypothetical protein
MWLAIDVPDAAGDSENLQLEQRSTRLQLKLIADLAAAFLEKREGVSFCASLRTETGLTGAVSSGGKNQFIADMICNLQELGYIVIPPTDDDNGGAPSDISPLKLKGKTR